VQLADLENAAYLPPGRCIKGMLAGNEDWRSPEAHFKGELNKPADVFSFGAVVSLLTSHSAVHPSGCDSTKQLTSARQCIYAMLGRVIFGRDSDMTLHESRGVLPMLIRLQRQVSYFGEKEGLNGLMKHVGDEEINCQILSSMWDDRTEENIPYEPFTDWPDAGDEDFKDLIGRMMNLDPTKRITARKGLDHAWFHGCD
jgi:serine/threonine protein kinase